MKRDTPFQIGALLLWITCVVLAASAAEPKGDVVFNLSVLGSLSAFFLGWSIADRS